MIRLEHLTIRYHTPILEDTGIELPAKKIISIIGPSGCGKSSLLYVLGLLSLPGFKTEYYFDDHKINLYDDKEKAHYRQYAIGYVFQENNVFEYMTLYENFTWIAKLCQKDITKVKMKEYLVLVDLEEIELTRYPSQLSEGQKQRFNIALMLSKEPSLLLLDEPTSNLDSDNKKQVVKILKNIIQHYDITLLIATHDERVRDDSDLVYEISDKKIHLITDTVIEEDHLKRTFPQKPITKELILYGCRQIKRHLLLNILSFILCGCCLGGGVFFSQFYKAYEEHMHQYYEDQRLTEIYVDPSVDKHLEEIEKHPNVLAVYPYDLYPVSELTIDDQIITGNFMVEFYNPKIYKETGIFVSSHLNDAPEGKTISLMMNDIPFTSTITGTINEDYESLYYDPITILIPYDIAPITLSKSLIYVDNIEEVLEISQWITSLSDYQTLQQGASLHFASSTIQSMSKIGTVYTIMLLLVIGIMLYMIYYRMILNRKEELLLLKTNGLTKKAIRLTFNTEMLCHIVMTTVVSFIVSIVCMYGFTSYYQMPMNTSILLLLIECFLLSGISITLIHGLHLYRLNRYEPSEILRKG